MKINVFALKRTYLLLLFVGFFSVVNEVQANNIEIEITSNFKKSSLPDIFSAISNNTNLTVSYGEFVTNNSNKYSINVNNTSVQKVLNDLSVQGKFNYVAQDNNVIISKSNKVSKPFISAISMNIIVKGTVTDASGMPLPGVNIIESGTTNGTNSDFDGNYTLEVKNQQSVIEFSYLGFKTKSVVVGEKSTLNIILQEDTSQLDEVVVIGYGTQKQKKVTTSIATVNVKDIEDFPVSNFDQALAGKAAGVQVLQTTGEPGRELDIRVRGNATVTAGNNPLYVLDGVPFDEGTGSGLATELVAMEDIESIQVLKDAASVAIYGSRGSNGVIIITTKKGKKGKMKVNYNQSIGFQTVSKTIDMMNGYEYAQMSREAHNAAYLQEVPTGSPDDPNSIRSVGYYKIPPELFPYLNGEPGLTDTNWQDEIFRNAVIERYNISVNGGNDNWNYLVSATHSKQEGIVINSDYTKTGLRANINLTSDKFNIGLNLSPSYTTENRVNANGPYNADGIVASALKMSPTWPVYNPDGSYNFDGNGFWRVGIDYQHNEILNPVALANEITNEIEHYNLLASLFVDYEVIDGLNLKSFFATTYNGYQNEYYRPTTLQQRRFTNYNEPAFADARLSNTNIYNWIWENTVHYNATFGSHNIDFLGGITAQKNRRKLNRTEGSVEPGTSVQNATQVINATLQDLKDIDASVIEWSLYSLLARVQYDYKGKYLFSTSIRADAHSRFAPNNKWGYFPSVSAGWRISKEDFLSNSKIISDLKLRASYGETGNAQIPNYAFLPLISQDNYALGNPGTPENGFRPVSLANPDLSWETSESFDIGLDVELFNRQIGITLDYYDSDSFDMLFEVPVPTITGFSRVLTNIGKLNNRGFEATLKLSPNLNDFKWNTNFNISVNRNQVKELGDGGTPIIESAANVDHATFITKIGEPIGSYYLLVQDGIFTNEEQLDQYPHFSTTQPGDFRYVDVDGNGIIDVNDDRTIVGNYAPDFTYGFSTALKYKGFDLNVALQGSYGGETLNLQRRYIANSEGNFNNMAFMANRWQSENNPGNLNINRANRKATGFNGRISTWHVEDGSYLRLQNVSLGYSFPKSLTDALRIDKLRVYVVGNNIYTWSNYSGFNPEVNYDPDGELTNGIDYGTYPLASTYSFGINVSF